MNQTTDSPRPLRGRREDELSVDVSGCPASQLGATIREWRKYHHLSVTDLAIAAGFGETGRSYISQIEHGHIQQVGGKRLHRIAEALGISDDTLETFIRPPDSADSVARVRLTPPPDVRSLQPDAALREYTDPNLETTAVTRVQPVLEKHGAVLIGIREVPLASTRMEINRLHWAVSRHRSDEYRVPPSVYDRVEALDDDGIAFDLWLWAENRIPFGVSVNTNCMLIGVITTVPDRGIWCLLGKWLQ